MKQALSLVLILIGAACSERTCQAALAPTVQWDVRTTGVNNNGGGFDTGPGTGTNFSLQNGPQVFINNSTITATCNGAVVTFTGNTYTVLAGDVNNIVNMTGGAGLAAGRYQIISVGPGLNGTWTLDQTTGMSGGAITAARMGGALLTIGQAVSVFVPGNVIWIKAGTFTVASPITIAAPGFLGLIGYQSTHGDNGTKPLITTASTVTLFIITGTVNLTHILFQNLSLSTTAVTRSSGISPNVGISGQITLDNLVMDGFTDCVHSDGTAVFQSIQVVNSEIKNCGTAAVRIGPGATSVASSLIWGSNIHDNVAGVILAPTAQSEILTAAHSLFVNNTTAISTSGPDTVQVLNSTISGGTTGISVTNTAGAPAQLTLASTILSGISGTAVNASASSPPMASGYNNAFGNNGTDRTNFPVLPGDVALSASPFISATNFGLNTTAGGGLACKGLGFPGAIPPGATTGHLDIGAVQSGAPNGCAVACVQ